MRNIEKPEDLDLVICGGHWSPDVVAEVAEYIRNDQREQAAKKVVAAARPVKRKRRKTTSARKTKVCRSS